MEHRAQTYLVSLQCLVIISGTIFASAGAKAVETTLNDPTMMFLRLPRLLAHYVEFLLIVPVIWLLLTIWGERSACSWASSKVTVLSGTVILIVLAGLFGWAGIVMLFPPYTGVTW